MKKIIVFLALCVVLISAIEISNVHVKQTTKFEEVNELVLQKVKQYGESEVIVVLDIDNTILTSEIDLGGDIWYQWQREKLDVKPDSNQIVDCLFEDAIGLLYELGTMKLTEEQVSDYIKNWQNSSITVFALTSRDPRYRTPTERELTKQKIDFSVTGLRPEGKDLPILRYNLDRELSYMKGIMMTTGMDKGKMLEHILEKTKRSFKSIVFVDDSEKNVLAVKNNYEKFSEIDVTILHYTKIEDDRENEFGTVLTRDQADKMAREWDAINSVLKVICPGRDLKSKCVSP
jgi:hypothetical protein